MRWCVLLLVGACWNGAASPRPPVALPLAIEPTKSIAASHEVRGPGEAPSIELSDALAAARRFADKHDVRFDHGQYLQGAVFDASARTWVFDWQVAKAKGGITIITVHESGQISINYGE